MKTGILLAIMMFFGAVEASNPVCVHTGYKKPIKVKEQKAKTPVNHVKINARVTFWCIQERGYTWGKQIASNPKGRAREGITAAVDPKKLEYGTKLFIPKLKGIVGDGMFIAEDTGKDVRGMKAIPKSKRKEVFHVIDIYVSSLAKMNEYSKKNPQYMEVYILKDVQLVSN